MNLVGPGSFQIKTDNGTIDVYKELVATRFVPVRRLETNVIEYDDEIQVLIMKYVKLGGFAELTLSAYLDGLYSTFCK